MTTNEELIVHAFDAFNRRDTEAVLAVLHPDVRWANGLEGGYVHGHAEVREYWTRQWTMIDPRVEPRRFETDASGRVVVEVHQTVRDLAGKLLADQVVQHVYDIEGNLVRSMEIRKP